MKIKISTKYGVGDTVIIKELSPNFVFKVSKVNVTVNLMENDKLQYDYGLELYKITSNSKNFTTTNTKLELPSFWELSNIKEDVLSSYTGLKHPIQIEKDLPFNKGDNLIYNYHTSYINEVMTLDRAICIEWTSSNFSYIKYIGTCIFTTKYNIGYEMELFDPMLLSDVNMTNYIEYIAKENTSKNYVNYFLDNGEKADRVLNTEKFFGFAGLFTIYEKVYNDLFEIRKQKILNQK